MTKSKIGWWKKHRDFLWGGLTAIIFIVLGVLTFFGIQNYILARYAAEHPIIETRKSMVKVLPPEVKKQLKTASPSATFRVPILLYHYVEYVQNKNDKL